MPHLLVSSVYNHSFSWSVDPLLPAAFTVKTKGNTHTSTPNSYQGSKKERPYCTKCQIQGHTEDTCYKIHGYPPGFRQNYRPSNHIPSPAKHHTSPMPGSTNYLLHKVRILQPTLLTATLVRFFRHSIQINASS